MQKIFGAVAGLTLAVALATPAHAQDAASTRAFTIGIAGGITMPMGDFGDAFDTGYNVMGSLGFRPATLPVGFSFDVAYHSLGFADGDDEIPGAEDIGDARILSGTGNVVLNFTTAGGIRPYLIGGVGLYNFDTEAGEGTTDFGLNAGGGLNFALSGFSTFLETRYHSVFTEEDNTNFLPIVFGIRF